MILIEHIHINFCIISVIKPDNVHCVLHERCYVHMYTDMIHCTTRELSASFIHDFIPSRQRTVAEF